MHNLTRNSSNLKMSEQAGECKDSAAEVASKDKKNFSGGSAVSRLPPFSVVL